MKYLFFTTLELFFKLIKWHAVQWLMHYMAGSGKKMTLPKIYNQLMYDTCYHTTITWDSDDPKFWGRSAWFCPEGAHNRIHRYKSLHSILGKCKLRGSTYMAHVLDKYVFYPACPSWEFHGPSTCTCDEGERNWSDVSVTQIRIPLPPPFKRKNFHSPCKQWNKLHNALQKLNPKLPKNPYGWRISTYLCMTTLQLTINVSDRWFADKGKPFYTVAHISQ